MSEMHTSEVAMSDKQCLVDSLKEMGYNVQEHDEAVQMRTYYERDRASSKANILVPKENFGGYADLGFQFVDGQVKMHCDDMDTKKFNLNKLKHLYAKSVVKKVVNNSAMYSLSSESQDEHGYAVLRITAF